MLNSGAGRTAAIGRAGVAEEVSGIMSSMPVCNNLIASANANARLLVTPREYRHNCRVTISHPDPAGGLRPQDAKFGSQFIHSAAQFVAASAEGRIVAWGIIGFIAVWMVYDTVSLWPAALHWDASEAALWAQHFAFGYKHPPMTAWLFAAWFAIFPRADWAAHLLAVIISAATLAMSWRLSRDHLDKYRALFGLAALSLIPLFTFKATELNAGTVMMPFWAAALLFYLRARRGLGVWNALLAGAFASLTMLGKYWAIYLFAGMAVAAVAGADARRFWRSPVPYLMAVGAAVVIAPHLYWYISQNGGSNYQFMRESVMNQASFGATLAGSLRYLLGVIAYAAGPLVLLAALRPGSAVLRDIAWPADTERRQALILFVVPLILPALVNLVLPHRLTAVWTYPNWALLPVVLYGSRQLVIDATASAAAGLVAVAMASVAVIASPVVAYEKLSAGLDPNRPDAQPVAAAAARLAGGAPVRLFWGSAALANGLPFYLPGARPLNVDPSSPMGRAASKSEGLLLVCLESDAPCRASVATLVGGDAKQRSDDIVIRHTFLGFTGSATAAHITVLPPSAQ
jgi:4-amino-4-deoxy-L-arabinose transferase-like glycosyltransferase